MYRQRDRRSRRTQDANQAPEFAAWAPDSRTYYLWSLFSVAVVVFVPSLCCVVVLSLEWPVEGFWVDVLLLFCPSGFSVVVVLELV